LAVPALAEALRSYIYGDVTNMQRIAAEALRQIGDPSAVPALIKVLHKYDDGQNLDMRSDAESVRVVAARALGKIGDPSAVPALDEALRKVTSQLKEEEHRLSFGLSLQMHMESLQEALVQALSEIGTSEAKQAILRYDDPAS